MDNRCEHAKYSDGHCATMTCVYYFSKCPRHSYSGRINEICTLEKKRVKSGS